jgi:hypothetical protein
MHCDEDSQRVRNVIWSVAGICGVAARVAAGSLEAVDVALGAAFLLHVIVYTAACAVRGFCD